MSRGTSIPFGRYTLDHRLAVGGMGEVYLGTQKSLGRFQKAIVLKLLLPHLAEDPLAVQMFLDEAHIAACMNHPNIVHIFDVGVTEGRYYIAMELVRGVTMSKVIRAMKARQLQFPSALVAYVARGLCDGLHHAHEQKGPDGKPLEVVHRDVSPQNVLLSVDGAVTLTDFGIAKARDSSIRTRPGLVKGKFEYIAPEQLAGGAIDRRADLFSAAVTLYHLLALESPFARDSDAATLRAVETAPLPPLGQRRPDLSPAIVVAIERSANKDPSQRFQSALEFRDAFPVSGFDGGPQALGALIADLCRTEIDALEAKSSGISSETPSVSVDLRTSPTAAEGTRPSPHKSRRLPIALALIAAVGLGGGAIGIWGIKTKPAPPGSAPSSTSAPEPARPEVGPAPPPATAPVGATAPTSGATPPPLPTQQPRPQSRPAPKLDSVGYITADADPWASVSIHGRKIGDTPLARFPVEPGSYQVKFTNPDSGKSVTRTVRVHSGKESFVRADLR